MVGFGGIRVAQDKEQELAQAELGFSSPMSHTVQHLAEMRDILPIISFYFREILDFKFIN